MCKRTTTLFFTAGLLLVVSIAVVVSPRIAGAQAPSDKPVEQTRKNIQVLKGLPDSQLFNVMNFMAASLGVRCDFCHVTEGKDPKTGLTKWIWESDDKPEKQSARRMMQMVLMINKSNTVDFRQNSVTCYSCHRGKTTTVALPSMPLTQSGHEPGPTVSAPATSAPRPTVDQIFTKYMEALGGTNVANTKTLVMKGNRVASQNRNWPNEITMAAPDKYLVVATTPQATVRQIVAGDKGWILNGANLRALTAVEVADIRKGWDSVLGIVKARQVPGMVYVGREKIGDRDHYVVVNSTAEKRETYYFDVASGLLSRKTVITYTAVVPVPEQIDFEDYRDVDGVKVPFVIRDSMIDTFNSWTRTFSEIKRNIVVDDSAFAAPSVPPK